MNRDDVPDHLPDDLLGRLRSADPAASLAAADPAAVGRLLEATTTDVRTVESRTDGLHRRSPLTWAVAAAAVVLLGVGAALLVGHRGPTTPAAGPVAGPPTSAPSGSAPTGTTRLVAAPTAGRCAVPSAAVLQGQQLAFAGTVSSVTGGVATLVPSTVYAGTPGGAVEVAAPDATLQSLLSAVDLQQGGHYLVAATGGRVAACGLSGPATPQLADLYAQAFGR